MANSKVNGDFILKLLVGILFVVIGIEGIANFGGNDLYQKLDEALRIIVGVVLLVAGLLMIVPSFIGGIKKSFVKVSTLIALVAWLIYIVLADFVYGLRGVDRSGSSGSRIWSTISLSCIAYTASHPLR